MNDEQLARLTKLLTTTNVLLIVIALLLAAIAFGTVTIAVKPEGF